MSLIRVYSNNGLSYRCEPDSYKPVPGEVSFPELPFATPAQLRAVFSGYDAALAAKNAPPPIPLDVNSLAAALVAKGLIAPADLVSALSTGAGDAIATAVADAPMPVSAQTLGS